MAVLKEEQQILEVFEPLPIDIKTEIIQKLIAKISPTNETIDKFWKVEAQRRLDALESKKVSLEDGKSLFARLQKQFN